MAFSDIQVKAISEAAIQAAHKNIAKLSLFAKSFSDLEGKYGESIGVPVYDLTNATAFDESNNNYGSGTNEVGGELINLTSHLVKSVTITDAEYAYTGIDWATQTATALADSLTRGVNSTVFGLINDTNCELTATNTFATKSLIAGLYATADQNDIPVDSAIVALAPTQFAKVLEQLDANVYGGSEAIRLGMIPGLYGFAGFVCTSNLPSGTVGAIIARDAVGIASRYLAPMTDGAYPEAWSVKNDDGFTIGFRRFADLAKGKNVFAADVLFGAKILQPNKIVRITG